MSNWPLFDLHLRIGPLELRPPDDDLLNALCAVAKAGVHPPDQMPFAVPWTRRPSPAFEREFLQFHWRNRADLGPAGWNLEFAVLLDGQPIGCQALMARNFATYRQVSTGSWLGKAHQGQGNGKQMRAAVLTLAFDHLGAQVAETSAFLENHPSAAVSRALGYRENGLGLLAPDGVARETQKFRLTREDWQAAPRPVVDVAGVDACRALVGA
jgi:RimJ/RimL family protein N-acetyltransferase